MNDLLRTHLARSMNLPFSVALIERTLPLDSYAGLLRALALVQAAVERVGPHHRSSVAPVHVPRSALLARDLEPLAQRELRETPGTMLRAALLAQDLQSFPTDDARFVAALSYALHASVLGQPSFRRNAERALSPDIDGSMAYLHSLEAPPDTEWQRIVDGADASTRALMIEGVRQILEGIEDILGSLYPLPSERLRDLVVALNSEAGHHAIPDDLREIEAALRAGETSLRHFPYYHERYGERGRRFTHSDSAWLVTLSDLTQPLVDQQIGWLGRVLASRGMPRWMLALHLDILQRELSLAIPERAHDYTKLHRAADRLHERRRSVLSDDILTMLEQAFDVQVGMEWRQRLPRTGALLAAAVADEADGIKRAVVSVETWMTDPALFPPAWIEAVKATLQEARSIVAAARSASNHTHRM